MWASVDEEIGGGAGADADDAGGHVLDGGAGRGLLHFILGHHGAIRFVVWSETPRIAAFIAPIKREA
jgi:hypothetical protein